MARVLIVEDEVSLAENIAEYLSVSQPDLDVHCLHSAEEALAYLGTSAADILLTDVLLPGMDGIELVRQAVRLRPQLRVVVMTAHGSPELRSSAMALGALRFAEKPIDLADLATMLQELAQTARGWSGSLCGLDLFDFTQLLVLAQKTCTVLARLGRRTGTLAFRGGQLEHASTGDLVGADAFYEIASWEGGSFEDVRNGSGESLPANVDVGTTHLMMEAARIRDEARAEGAVTAPPDAGGFAPPADDAPVRVPEDGSEGAAPSGAGGRPPTEVDSELADDLCRAAVDAGLEGDAWIVTRGGVLLASTVSPDRTGTEVQRLWALMEPLLSSSPRGTTRRLVLEDPQGTVVAAPLGMGRWLLLTTGSAVRLGAITVQAARLIDRLHDSRS